MSIKANILRDAQGNINVHMQGDLNYEFSSPLRMQLEELSKTNPNASINIDLGGIDFVGSSGICHFIETLTLLKAKRPYKLSLSNVTQDFKKVFRLYAGGDEDVEQIMAAFGMDTDETENLSQNFARRSRTFEN